MNTPIRRRPHALLPVVHALEEKQALEQASVAMTAGADGVFFINQGGNLSARDLLGVARTFAAGGTFVGVNQLGRNRILRNIVGIHGIWTDDLVAGIDPAVLYFGGVAFKYQPEVKPDDLIAEVKKASTRVQLDVVTTSGTATGSAPDLEKIRTIHSALASGQAMAIASGVSAENVEPFLPYTWGFLVASSLERKFGVFEPSKIQELRSRIPQK